MDVVNPTCWLFWSGSCHQALNPGKHPAAASGLQIHHIRAKVFLSNWCYFQQRLVSFGACKPRMFLYLKVSADFWPGCSDYRTMVILLLGFDFLVPVDSGLAALVVLSSLTCIKCHSSKAGSFIHSQLQSLRGCPSQSGKTVKLASLLSSPQLNQSFIWYAVRVNLYLYYFFMNYVNLTTKRSILGIKKFVWVNIVDS